MRDGNPIDISSLHYDAVDVQPVNFDFGSGWNETWEEVYLPYVTCPWCNKTFPDTEHEEGDACPDCKNMTSHLERPECAPMMNYYYPLPNYLGDRDPEADQLLLHESAANVVLARITDGTEDGYALALSGGGMDLSWDICLAYILLGYAPPLHFCDLPEFAGQDNRGEPFWSILKACLQSVEAKEQRGARRKEQLIKLVESALACPGCGHSNPHNRVGGCEYGSDIEDNPTTRCPCLTYPEGRPADAEAVRGLA